MDFKLVDTVRLQKFKDKLLSIINTNVTTINNSISSEATARDAAISKAIATEVSNRNTELAKKSDTGHTHSDATTSASGFMSATDKTKLDGIATGAGVQVNSDWNATNGFAQILNKPTLATVATSGSYTDLSGTPALATVATSGSYTDLSGTPTIPTVPTQVSAFQNDSGYLTSHQSLADYALKTEIPTVPTQVSAFQNDSGYLTSHQSLADYALKTEIPTVITYTAGTGIKIEDGVISVINNKINNAVAIGYTLYGDYFLSDTIIPNKNWNEAYNMTEKVSVIQDYTLGSRIKIVNAHTLSKEELETLTVEQRKISENGHKWYWTSTPYNDKYAWLVFKTGRFSSASDSEIADITDSGGARLGFKNPFI